MSSKTMASRIRPASSEIHSTVVEWPRLGDPVANPEPAPGRPRAAQPTPPPAEQDTAELRKQMEQQFQQKLQAEKHEAHRQGEASGRQKAAADFEAAVERMARSIEEVAGMKSRLRKQAERDVVTLALAMARRVLRRQVTMDEEALLGLVKAAFENVSMREVTEVRVHPQFVTRIQGHLAKIGAPQAIHVQGDGALEVGGLVVETGRGSLDASIETQMEEIGRGLSDALSVQGGAV
ncbi:FliH/SctL family protein [uncultured Paludibaculum sp.]|uniref:FliH/SctL family protein n=1 Tax=uncultured Paludibaculum sp. TaxID=1765020 RepID=UPI002AAAAF84|nr:FliH/SctL family protein [uncultured Paludibaculum sp.]